jgi:DNA-binding transcriptional MerR regulator
MGVQKKRAVEITGLSPRRVQFYVDHSVITIRVRRGGEGRGAIIEYSDGNLVDLMIIKELIDYGMTVSKIKQLNKIIHDNSLFNDKFTIYKFKNFMENLPVYLHIFNDGTGEFQIEFRESTPTAIDMEKYPSCITINYSRIIKIVNAGLLRK